jgi:hypothetical protein
MDQDKSQKESKINELLMFAWIMNRPVKRLGPFPGLGSLAVQRSIEFSFYLVAGGNTTQE